MDKTLKTLHLRLDSTSKSLTKNAIGQVIVKMLFLAEKSLSAKEICNQVDRVFSTKLEEQKIIDSINKLSGEKLIKEKKKKYYLATTQKKKINQAYVESKERLDRIIEVYFEPFESDISEIKEWISDTTMLFFNEFSTDWISDICYKKSAQIEKQKSSILELIKQNTENRETLQKEERIELCQKFVKFITTNDVDVNSHLWEYGTSAFASTLINTSLGIDPLSLTAFKDSKCILDTNVLMNIGLEASQHHKSFKQLDLVFSKLNIQPGYLHITKEEYKRTVGNKRDEIIKSVEKFPYDVIQETDDNYVQTAILRQCITSEDFSQFFQQVIDLPRYVDEKHEILLFDSDTELEKAINIAIEDEQKQIELNSLYRRITNRDKRPIPLQHDVGLIAGNEYLRSKNKCFIISQEISINEYAKQKPSKKDLPFALRLETLISMLAIDNGGTDINPNDYSTLFANIIRFNLFPAKDTFKVTDLSKLLETELQIAQLPKDEIIEIAKDVHRNRTLGLPDEKISLELARKFQGAKLNIVDDLDETRQKLSLTEIEKERHKKESNTLKEALKKQIRIDENESFVSINRRNNLIYFVLLPVAVTILTLIGIHFINNTEQSTQLASYIIGLAGNVGFWLLTSFIFTKKRLKKSKESRKILIEDKVEQRVKNELNKATQ